MAGASISFKQSPNSVAFVCIDRKGNNVHQDMFGGDDCVHKFIIRMLDLQKQIDAIPIVPINMSPADQLDYESATKCHICKQELTPNDLKNKTVRDHDHFTGEYCGAAHNKCNLRLRNTSKLPVFLHNGKKFRLSPAC
jgi:hypothetical protein